MATYATQSASVALVTANLPGLSRGRIAMRPGPNGATTVHPSQPALGAWRTAGPGNGDPISTNQGGTQFTRELSIGIDWFDHVHILPRTKIDFGNIVTTVQEPFEIFNAYGVAIAFTLYVNNAGAGVEIPDLPVPTVDLGAYRSLLSPSSTRMVPVRLNVEASPNGPPFFDSTIEFTFSPGGIVFLEVTGLRVALFMPEFNGDVVETLEWVTDVQELANGEEQRVSLRRNPRQSFEVEVLVDGRQRRHLRSQLFGWSGRTFGLPLWHERKKLSVAVSIGALTATVVSTANVDLRVGGLAVLYKDDQTFDVLEIESITATVVTFVSQTQNAYAIGDLLMPVRVSKITGPVEIGRHPVELERHRFVFSVIDNDTGAPTASTGSLTSHAGHVLLDSPNVMDGTEARQSSMQAVTTVDGQTGVIFHDSLWTRARHGFPIGFSPKTLADLYALRLLLYAIRGRQVAFWAPTWIDDLVVTQNLVISGTTMVVENVGYTRYVDSLEPRATFRIKFTDNTTLIRTILSSVETSAAEETLTLDSAWPASKTVAQIDRLDFIQLSRFDSDRLQLVHRDVGRAKLTAPAVVVFDEP